MRNWWTTVGAVALCAAAAPSAWAAKAPARHAAQSSLRGHQSADEGSQASRGKKTDSKKTSLSKKEAAAEKACAAAKTRAAKAKLCPKDEPDDEVAVGTLPDARGKVSELTPAPEKVGKGDTLYAISRRTGVSVDDLIELNKLKKPYHVRIGATLKVPKTRAYIVHSGDTLSGVAVRFSIDTDVLAAFNAFSTDTTIRTGQKIYLPPNAEDKAPKLRPTPAKPAAKPTPPKPRPAVIRPAPPPVREPEPAPVEAEPAPQPETRTPSPPPAQPYRPPAQTGSYPGATALPPVRTEGAPAATTPAPQPATQAPPPQAAAPQPSPPKPAVARPDKSRKPAPPTYAAPQPERPAVTPPEESSGIEMVPATPAPTPTPTYRPPAASSRPSIIQTNPAPTQSQVATAGRGRFIWPVRGNVLSAFGLKANGQKNDGLNILVTTGEPVRAAAAGEVVYAGDQVPSFGNLVLIKHAGGWVTAYAHLGRIAVSNRDQVTQGQQIGVGGQTGTVDQPQLHFEIRYAASPADKALPVDPSLVLPER